MRDQSETIRILDAALNRASEGLRAVEDYVRFALDDGHLTAQLKLLRHELAAAGAVLPADERANARDVLADVGTTISTPAEGMRADALAVCRANMQRAKQSLRSLEEYAKVITPEGAARFEALRYRLYTIESALDRTTAARERLANCRLYVLIDGRRDEGEFRRLVEELIAAGVDAFQLRDKSLNDRALIGRVRATNLAAYSHQDLPFERLVEGP